jgi:anti-anti-sigma factor
MNDGAIAIAKAESHGVEIISLEGDLDLTNANLVREAVEATRSEAVVLDLSAVTFLDSMAISTLEGGHRRLASEDRSLVVVSPPATPSTWTLRVTGIDDGVVCESLDDALLAALARHTAA